MGIVGRFLGAFLSTAWRRARRGPLLPSWSLPFEASVAFLRETNRLARDMTPLEERALMAGLKPPPSPVMREVKRSPVDAGGVRAEWFAPAGERSDGVVIFIHGGAFIFGSITSHAEMIARTALATGARVLALDHRLAPEHAFPAQLDDVVAAYRWLLAQGTAPSKVALMGDSSGGNLAVAALLKLRELGLPMPAGSVPVCPWVDLARTGGSMESNERYDWGVAARFPRWAEAYAPGRDLRDPLVSPLYADLRGLPPMLVLHGDREMLHDMVDDFVARARAQGAAVEHEAYPEMVHNWMTLHAYTPQAQRAYDRVGAFVRRVTAA